MSNFLWECMVIAIKGTIGMLSIMAIIIIALGIFLGAIEFFKVLFSPPSKPKTEPSPEASEPTIDKASQEEHFTIIKGGKEDK